MLYIFQYSIIIKKIITMLNLNTIILYWDSKDYNFYDLCILVIYTIKIVLLTSIFKIVISKTAYLPLFFLNKRCLSIVCDKTPITRKIVKLFKFIDLLNVIKKRLIMIFYVLIDQSIFVTTSLQILISWISLQSWFLNLIYHL